MQLNKSHTGNMKKTTLRHNIINCLKSMIKKKYLNQKEKKERYTQRNKVYQISHRK